MVHRYRKEKCLSADVYFEVNAVETGVSVRGNWKPANRSSKSTSTPFQAARVHDGRLCLIGSFADLQRANSAVVHFQNGSVNTTLPRCTFIVRTASTWETCFGVI